MSENKAEGCTSGCCDGSVIEAPEIRGDNTTTSRQCSSENRLDSSLLTVPRPAKEEPAKDGCGDGCCFTKSVSIAIENSETDDCNDGCCGSVKPKEVQKINGEMRQGIHGLKDRLNFQNVKIHIAPLPSHPSSWWRSAAMASRSLAAMV